MTVEGGSPGAPTSRENAGTGRARHFRENSLKLHGYNQHPRDVSTPSRDCLRGSALNMTEGGAIAEIDVIARHRRDRKGKSIPLMNTDQTDFR
jgi:hypothetical protein